MATNALANWSLVAVTLGLLIATVIYSWYTRKQVIQMRKSREADWRPVVTASIEHMYTTALHMVIRNTGNGAAHNVNAEWRIKGLNGSERQWHMPVIPVDEEHTFFLPVGEPEDDNGKRSPEVSRQTVMDALEDADGTLVVNIEYEDGLGEEHTVEEEIDVQGMVEKREAGGEIFNKDMMEQIRNAIEDVSDGLDALSDIEGQLETWQKTEGHVRLRNFVEEEGTVSVKELFRMSGLSTHRLWRILEDWKEQGFVDYDDIDWEDFHNEWRDMEIEHAQN